MTKILGIAKPYGVKISKKWGRPTKYGVALYADNQYGDDGYGAGAFGNTDDLGYGIYQQRKCKEGKITVKMKFYEPTQTWSQAKEDSQNKFAAAVAAYQLLTAEQKLVYHKRAVGRHFTGYNLFLKEYMSSH